MAQNPIVRFDFSDSGGWPLGYNKRGRTCIIVVALILTVLILVVVALAVSITVFGVPHLPTWLDNVLLDNNSTSADKTTDGVAKSATQSPSLWGRLISNEVDFDTLDFSNVAPTTKLLRFSRSPGNEPFSFDADTMSPRLDEALGCDPRTILWGREAQYVNMWPKTSRGENLDLLIQGTIGQSSDVNARTMTKKSAAVNGDSYSTIVNTTTTTTDDDDDDTTETNIELLDEIYEGISSMLAEHSLRSVQDGWIVLDSDTPPTLIRAHDYTEVVCLRREYVEAHTNERIIEYNVPCRLTCGREGRDVDVSVRWYMDGLPVDSLLDSPNFLVRDLDITSEGRVRCEVVNPDGSVASTTEFRLVADHTIILDTDDNIAIAPHSFVTHEDLENMCHRSLALNSHKTYYIPTTTLPQPIGTNSVYGTGEGIDWLINGMYVGGTDIINKYRVGKDYPISRRTLVANDTDDNGKSNNPLLEGDELVRLFGEQELDNEQPFGINPSAVILPGHYTCLAYKTPDGGSHSSSYYAWSTIVVRNVIPDLVYTSEESLPIVVNHKSIPPFVFNDFVEPADSSWKDGSERIWLGDGSLPRLEVVFVDEANFVREQYEVDYVVGGAASRIGNDEDVKKDMVRYGVGVDLGMQVPLLKEGRSGYYIVTSRVGELSAPTAKDRRMIIRVRDVASQAEKDLIYLDRSNPGFDITSGGDEKIEVTVTFDNRWEDDINTTPQHTFVSEHESYQFRMKVPIFEKAHKETTVELVCPNTEGVTSFEASPRLRMLVGDGGGDSSSRKFVWFVDGEILPEMNIGIETHSLAGKNMIGVTQTGNSGLGRRPRCLGPTLVFHPNPNDNTGVWTHLMPPLCLKCNTSRCPSEVCT